MLSDDPATMDSNTAESTTDVDPSKESGEDMTEDKAEESSYKNHSAVVVSPEEERKRKTADDENEDDDNENIDGKIARHAKDTTEQDDAPHPPTNDGDNDEDPPPNHEDSDADDESDTEAKTQESEPRRPRPPLRPIKRARTAYFIFTDEKRPMVQAEHPGEAVAVVARIMGQMWSTLSAEEKEKYQQQAALERERVAKELEEYKAAGGIFPEDAEASSKLDPSNNPGSLIYPVGRIRKICKLDPEVRGISKEALLLIAKCAELATAKLGQEAVKVAQIQNRRKLLPEDVAHVCSHREQFLFLKDDIKDLVKETMLPNNNNNKAMAAAASHGKKADSAKELAAVGSKPLTSYFASVAAPK